MKMTQFERSENSNIHLLIHSLDERYKKELQFFTNTKNEIFELKKNNQNYDEKLQNLSELVQKLAKIIFINELILNISKFNDSQGYAHFFKTNKIINDALDEIYNHFIESDELDVSDEKINSLIEKIENNELLKISNLQTYYDRRKYAAIALITLGFVTMFSLLPFCFIYLPGNYDYAILATAIFGLIISGVGSALMATNLPQSIVQKEKTNTQNIALKHEMFFKESTSEFELMQELKTKLVQ